jgi:hypothetical protein
LIFWTSRSESWVNIFLLKYEDTQMQIME